MNIKKGQKMFGVLVVAVLLIGGFFLYIRPNRNIDTSSDIQATSTIPQVLIDALGDGEYTIEQVPVNEGGVVPINSKVKQVPIPDLSRSVVFDSKLLLSVEVKNILTLNITTLQTDLRKNPTELTKWIDLGIYRKMAGDYEGAIVSWKYVSDVADHDFISFGNLGNMYAYQLKDMVKAEQYYNQAIKNGPTQIYLYIQLAEAFRDVSKDMVKARAVIDRGLLANPNNAELLVLKDSLK